MSDELYKSDEEKDALGHSLDPHVVFVALNPEGKSFCRAMVKSLRAAGARAWLDGVRSKSLTAAFDKWTDGKSLIFTALVGPKEVRAGHLIVKHARTWAKEVIAQEDFVDRVMGEIAAEDQGEEQ